MAHLQNYKKKTNSAEMVGLGTFWNRCGDLLVIKLEHNDIPYPNSPVIYNNKQIGKIDEVFGRIGEAYASVKGDGDLKGIKEGSQFRAYKDKFINRNRFTSREETENKKGRAQPKDKQMGNRKGQKKGQKGGQYKSNRNGPSKNERNYKNRK